MRVLWEHVGSEAYSHHMREYPNARMLVCAYARMFYGGLLTFVRLLCWKMRVRCNACQN